MVTGADCWYGVSMVKTRVARHSIQRRERRKAAASREMERTLQSGKLGVVLRDPDFRRREFVVGRSLPTIKAPAGVLMAKYIRWVESSEVVGWAGLGERGWRGRSGW